jgi:hypothetical protein
LRIDFDPASVPMSYAKLALAGLRRRLAEFSSETGRIPEMLPAFGCPIGVIVNYMPNRAVRFDLNGDALETLPRAHRLAEPYVALRRRPVRPATLRVIMAVK